MSSESATKAPNRGGIAGASGDGGVEYRRAVAAYAVAYGLVGMPLPGFGAGLGLVQSVALETDDPVDDIKISFDSGEVTYVQAKRRLQKGVQFESAVAQWVEAAKKGIDPKTEHLIIVAGSVSGPLTTLREVLETFKLDIHASFTNAQSDELHHLDGLLAGLNDDQRLQLKRSASIHVLDVEEHSFAGSREGALLLARLVDTSNSIDPWKELVHEAGRAARLRGGFRLKGWLDALRKSGVIVASEGGTPAAELEKRHRTVSDYLHLLRTRGSRINLRSLGAELPPLTLAEVDADIEVQVDKGDSRSGEHLLWAYLRRGRIVVTGLPGGGKSTAMDILAARLADLSDAPLPVAASLKKIDGLDRTASFEERLLEDALSVMPSTERDRLRAEIQDRLVHGGVTLILDSLDETYSRRGDVVSEIQTFIESISPDIDVVLATRDVAYGQAATLQWPPLRLMAPKELDRTIRAILVRAADREFGQLSSGGSTRAEQWIAVRHEWVMKSLTDDGTLVETPLLPILLTLLSIERDASSLPSGRAWILWAVVSDVVRRKETHRTYPFALGALDAASSALAAIEAFAIEGRLIVSHGGQVAKAEVRSAFEHHLQDRWALADGPAQVTAESLINFWDESGIFVMAGRSESISARLMLFAEIGDAYFATKLDFLEMTSWIEQRSAAGSIESLILASGLSESAADGMAEIATNSSDRDLLHAVIKAVHQGASVSPDNLHRVLGGIAGDASKGGSEGWDSWVLLGSLSAADFDQESVETILSVFPESYQVLGRALIDLHWKTSEELIESPDRLLRLLELERLDQLASRHADGRAKLRPTILVHQGFTDAKIDAARVLLGRVEAATAPLLESLRWLSMNGARELMELLQERGFAEEVEEARRSDRESFARTVAMWSKFDFRSHERLLSGLAGSSTAPLTFAQRNRLHELADFLKTINMDQITAWPETVNDEFLSTLELLIALGGFDDGVLASQSLIVLRRMEESGEPTDPYYSLFDGAKERELDRWDQVSDHAVAVDLLVSMLSQGLGAARVAASALWGAPVEEMAAPKIRRLISRLDNFSQHQRIAAWVLCQFPNQAEPQCWSDDPNPLLRSVLAELCEEEAEGRISPTLQRLLDDPDGNVQDAAVRRLGNPKLEDRISELNGIRDRPDPGWKCLSCGTPNQAGLSVCSKKKCYRSSPSPSQAAAEMLEGKAVDRAVAHFDFDFDEEEE